MSNNVTIDKETLAALHTETQELVSSITDTLDEANEAIMYEHWSFALDEASNLRRLTERLIFKTTVALHMSYGAPKPAFDYNDKALLRARAAYMEGIPVVGIAYDAGANRWLYEAQVRSGSLRVIESGYPENELAHFPKFAIGDSAWVTQEGSPDQNIEWIVVKQLWRDDHWDYELRKWGDHNTQTVWSESSLDYGIHF